MAEGERDPSFSIVEYMSDHSGYKCGYCKSSSTNFSHGMWAHRMTVGDYQDLIDRGWRRSGRYCYKPTMNKTCCPMYTIKCDALEVKLTKAQKKVLKRMHRYLSYGDTKTGGGGKSSESENCESPEVSNVEFVKPRNDTALDLSSVSVSPTALANAKGTCVATAKESEIGSVVSSDPRPESANPVIKEPEKAQDRKADTHNYITTKIASGPDPTKAPCKKSKLIRLERREAKLAKRREEALSRGETLMEVAKTKSNNTPKSLEDFLNEPLPESPAHKLEVKLVRSHPASVDFVRTFSLAHKAYQRYQIDIHGDSPMKCSEQQYKRFLCNSPLELKLVRVHGYHTSFRDSFEASYGVYRNYQLEIHHDSESECDKNAFQSFLVDGPLAPWQPHCGPPDGYGSFHHQYWLDGRLIAVGVLDVLPYCVSSVYLYYDPEFSFLSLGTYASLREIALTRQLHRSAAALRWYYMGFYIHSCPKMRYKGNYSPSYLLCPETYIWVSITEATPKLEISKYSRLNEDKSATDKNGNVDLNRIKIFHNQDLILYQMYRRLRPDEDDEEEVEEYSLLAGAKSAYSMLLYRN